MSWGTTLRQTLKIFFLGEMHRRIFMIYAIASGAILWNSLPQDVKAAESITSFKTMAKLHLSR